jgi:hypothetical protein
MRTTLPRIHASVHIDGNATGAVLVPAVPVSGALERAGALERGGAGAGVGIGAGEVSTGTGRRHEELESDRYETTGRVNSAT